MNRILGLRLSAMMFAMYFMYGAWFVTLGTYMSKGLGFDAHIGLAYGMQGIGAIASTLLVGALADRFVAAQKVTGVLGLLAGGALLWLADTHASPQLFVGIVLGVFLFFIPMLPLTNSIAFHSLTDIPRQFPKIRVWGVVGWIVAGVVIGSIPGAAATSLPLQLAGWTGIALGLYAFTLPDTPPRAAGQPMRWSSLIGLDVVLQRRDRAFWVFIASSLLVCIPLAFYYAYCNNFLVEAGAALTVSGRHVEATAIQALGQASEALLMLALPFFLMRLGIKVVLIVGMLAWSARYVMFAFGIDAGGPVMGLLLAGILLHGVCYDFFFVASQIHMDRLFDPAARARAQSFLTMVTLGIGMLIGSNVGGAVYQANTLAGGAHDWRAIWLVPAGLAFVVAVAFALLFRSRASAGPG